MHQQTEGYCEKQSMPPRECQTNSSIVEILCIKTSLSRHTGMESNRILHGWYYSAALGTKSFLWKLHIFVMWLSVFLFQQSRTEKTVCKLRLIPVSTWDAAEVQSRTFELRAVLWPHSLAGKRKSCVLAFIIRPQSSSASCFLFLHPPLLKLSFPTVSPI